MLLILPLPWIVAFLLASCFHELCHYAALRLSGHRVIRLGFGTNGILMETQFLSNKSELFCTLAGPLGGLCLLFFGRWFPRTAICAGLQSLYNLLPIYPLDGGRILRCLARQHLPPGVAMAVEVWVQRIFLGGILILLAAAFWYGLGILPLIAAGMLIMRIKKEKLLANRRSCGYNRANLSKEVRI